MLEIKKSSYLEEYVTFLSLKTNLTMTFKIIKLK